MIFNMMIFWKENLAFLAVPKTGSTAIEAALEPYSSVSFIRPPKFKHMTHKRFNRFMRPWLEIEGVKSIETFAVMREPVSWLGSWYRYRGRDELIGHANSTHSISFDEFIDAYLGEGARPAYATLGSQAQQLSRKQGETGITHLFRYEDMDHIRTFLSNRFSRKLEFSHCNVSPDMPLDISPKNQRRLEEKHAFDFATYDDITS
ncbi:MAG: hypothetical protein ACI861_001970 [Paracoccaceae bacterium]|jgi:hypothetical protein